MDHLKVGKTFHVQYVLCLSKEAKIVSTSNVSKITPFCGANAGEGYRVCRFCQNLANLIESKNANFYAHTIFKSFN